MLAAKFLTLTTNADGTTATAFPDAACHALSVLNVTGASLSFFYPGVATAFVLPNGMAWTFRGLNNASQLSVKRTDESTSTVTLNSVEVEL